MKARIGPMVEYSGMRALNNVSLWAGTTASDATSLALKTLVRTTLVRTTIVRTTFFRMTKLIVLYKWSMTTKNRFSMDYPKSSNNHVDKLYNESLNCAVAYTYYSPWSVWYVSDSVTRKSRPIFTKRAQMDPHSNIIIKLPNCGPQHGTGSLRFTPIKPKHITLMTQK